MTDPLFNIERIEAPLMQNFGKKCKLLYQTRLILVIGRANET
jgi:hypothetical protein